MKRSDELDQLLKNLHLKRILEIYDEQIGAAEKEDLSYSEFLTRLLRAQWHNRQETALAWRIKRANLPENWSLATFPFARQPGVSRKQIHTLAELDFVAKAENIVLIGKTAVGKTGLGTGLLLKALENGYRCQFIRAQDLFDELYASFADRSSRKLLNRLVRLDVLLIDELGYVNVKAEQANIFFKLTTATPFTSTARRCASPKDERTNRGGTNQPGRVRAKSSSSLPRNSGNHRPCEPARPPAGRPTASTRRTLRSCRERSDIGGSTSPLPSCRRFPFGHGSLLGLLPPCDRGSARTQDQSGLLSLRPQQTSSLLLGLI